MIASTIIDFLCGKIIFNSNPEKAQRKIGLLISIAANLSILGFFKYGNFFAENVSILARSIGLGEIVLPEFFNKIILPIGISFYTFQSMSYTIDIYRKKALPAENFLTFACYVSMFPQLVAGPIVRYSDIAKQLKSRIHSAGSFIYGFTRFNYGFAKKILLANPVGEIADLCFSAGQSSLSTPAAWIGVICYAFQIYFDFSAYSDMAIGLGKMFGFTFRENFDSPYKSGSITEFWRRWHISLSTWFRDYLYIPLGGSKVKRILRIRNIFIIFIVSGFWHGANWTYIIWGALHALYYIPLMLLKKNRKNLTVIAENKIVPSIKDFCLIISTFTLTTFAWIFFRSESITHALGYINNIFSLSIFSLPSQFGGWRAIITLLVISFLILVEWMQREKQHALDLSSFNLNRFIRWTIYLIIIFIIINFGGRQQEFIYFQF